MMIHRLQYKISRYTMISGKDFYSYDSVQLIIHLIFFSVVDYIMLRNRNVLQYSRHTVGGLNATQTDPR